MNNSLSNYLQELDIPDTKNKNEILDLLHEIPFDLRTRDQQHIVMKILSILYSEINKEEGESK